MQPRNVAPGRACPAGGRFSRADDRKPSVPKPRKCVIRTPIRAPPANGYAERFVRSVREECLDWPLLAGRRHLEHVLRRSIEYYHRERPHRGLNLSPPEPNALAQASPTVTVERRDQLGGLPHEYDRIAA
jgi:putative transposase